MRWLAVTVNTLAILLTSDLPWVFFSLLLRPLHSAFPWFSGSLLNAVVVFPGPTALLAMGGFFYLWVYASRSVANSTESTSGVSQ